MSLSSGTTLISPSGGSSKISNHPAHPSAPHRRGSTHSSHGPRRRASVHHAHGGHHGRRPSEGDSGRRALAAGLAMQALETTSNAKSTAMRRTTSGDRPLAKSSRSDTHLPTISRRPSSRSDGSRDSSRSRRRSNTQTRPKLGDRKKSGESTRVLSSDGLDAEGEEVDSAEEGWESGEDEQEEAPRKSGNKSNGASVDMRRTVSDSVAHVPSKAGSVKAVTEFDLTSNDDDHRPAMTKRTTGFAGSQHPAQDPELEQLSNLNAHTPHYNNAAHVRPAHQVRHQQSAKSINISRSSTEAALNSITALDDEKTPKPGSISRTGSGHSLQQPGKENRPAAASQNGPDRPVGPQKMRSTVGSGLPPDVMGGKATSPSFPFPQVLPGGTQSTSPEQRMSSPTSPRQTTLPKTRQSDPPQVEGRRRLTSGPAGSGHEAPRLRHRYSNSSLRSIQSLRAPPHPLNSPTGGYRSGLPGSRPGSAFNSPVKGGKRVPSMHQPPIAPPVVYRTVAQGEGYAIPEDSEAQLPPSASSSSVNPRGLIEPSGRKGSFSSQQSLQGIINTNGIKQRVPPSPARSVASSIRPYTSRRRTALEVASAAAKMSTTSNPVEYHHSLGFSSTLAETSHLISRFLPPKKTRHIEWEITPDNLVDHSGVGLSRGDYRDAHESLIRMMREQTIGPNGSRRTVNRSLSYQTLLGTHSTLSSLAQHAAQGLHGSTVEDSVTAPQGAVPGSGARNGVAAAKDGWNGKTPFELSVDRCIAQRPRRK